jgi:hypothetical protein
VPAQAGARGLGVPRHGPLRDLAVLGGDVPVAPFSAQEDSPVRTWHQAGDARERRMIIRNQEEVSDAVLGVMERTAEPRLREIMISLVEHLHGFVREVRLTKDEFQAATGILDEMGQLKTTPITRWC